MRRHELAACRRARGFSQEGLAHRLGVDRTTVGRWEQGTSTPQPWQRAALADALAVGLDVLHDMLSSDSAPTATDVAGSLSATVDRLEQASVMAHDRRRQSVLRLLGQAHHVSGEVAFDQLRFSDASNHFHSAQELGVEIGDADMIAAALTQLGDIARRQARYGTALRVLSSAERHAATASVANRVVRHQILARLYAETGDRPSFEQAIGRAEELAEQTSPEHHREGDRSPRGMRLERGQGLTVLGDPMAALAIYEDSSPPAFHTDRERGSFLIIHAQALAHGGHLDEGVHLAIQGLELARIYGSPRHVSRVQRMHDRLARALPRSEPRLAELRDALAA